MDATSTVIKTIEVPVVSPDYVALLERVNDVNATGLALANTFIGLLAVVLTAVGIFVAYFTWRNSREQKEERRRIYAEHGAQLAEQYQVLVTTYEEKIKTLMDKIEAIAQTAENTGNGVTDTKEQLEALVTDYQHKLEALKDPVDDRFVVSTVDEIPMVRQKNTWQFDNIQKSIIGVHDAMFEVKKCPHCRKKYKISKYDSFSRVGIVQNVCPHCGEDV